MISPAGSITGFLGGDGIRVGSSVTVGVCVRVGSEVAVAVGDCAGVGSKVGVTVDVSVGDREPQPTKLDASSKARSRGHCWITDLGLGSCIKVLSFVYLCYWYGIC